MVHRIFATNDAPADAAGVLATYTPPKGTTSEVNGIHVQRTTGTTSTFSIELVSSAGVIQTLGKNLNPTGVTSVGALRLNVPDGWTLQIAQRAGVDTLGAGGDKMDITLVVDEEL